MIPSTIPSMDFYKTSDFGNAFQQVWSPCTQGSTVHRHLQSLEFPFTFRKLCFQWLELGRPRLTKLHYPDGLLYGISEQIPENIEVLTSLQEVMTLSVFAGYTREGIIPPPKPFRELASHIDIYCSIKVELDTILYHCSEVEQLHRYNIEWRNAIAAFNQDRTFCSSLPPHGCLGKLFWGDLFSVSNETIFSHFHEYLQRQRERSNNNNDPNSRLFSSSSAMLLRNETETKAESSSIPVNLSPPITTSSQPSSSSSSGTTNNPNTDLYWVGAANRHFPPSTTSTARTAGTNRDERSFARSSINNNFIDTGDDDDYNDESSASPPSEETASYHTTGSYDSPRLHLMPLDNNPSSSSASSSSSPSLALGSYQMYSSSSSSNSTTNPYSSSSAHQILKNDARAEQNRRKSKKHYERKKLQRALLGDIVTRMEGILQAYNYQNKGHLPWCIRLREALVSTLPPPFELTNQNSINNNSKLTANEKKKMNKRFQNHIELERITQVSNVATALYNNGNVPSKTQRLLFLSAQEVHTLLFQQQQQQQQQQLQLQQQQHTQQQQQQQMHTTSVSAMAVEELEPVDVFMLCWIGYRRHWDELSSAENRLSRRKEKSIANFVNFLRQLSASLPS